MLRKQYLIHLRMFDTTLPSHSVCHLPLHREGFRSHLIFIIIHPDKSIFVIYSHIKAKGKKDEASKRHGYDSYFFRSEPAGMGAKGGHSEALTEKKYMSYTHG